MYRKTQEYINLQQKRLTEENLSFLQKLTLRCKLFIFCLLHSVLHSMALLFTPADRCFVLANNQDPNGTWSRSYYQHLLFQRRLRLYSTSSFFAIVIASVSVTLAFNILFPPTEIKMVQAAGNTCTVQNLNDAGNGSLRNCLASVITDGDTIAFNPALNGVINATTTLVLDKSDVVINSNANIMIDGSAIGGVEPAFKVSGDRNAVNNLITNNSNNGIAILGNNNVLSGIVSTNSVSNGVIIDGAIGTTMNGAQINNNGADALRLNNNATNTTVNNVNIGGNSGPGIFTQAASNLVLNNCTVTNNSSGALIENSTLTITNGAYSGNTNHGLQFSNINSATITGATIQNNGQRGIALETNNSNLTIRNNTISGNSNRGIDVGSSNNITIDQNTIQDNTGHGINLNNSNQNQITTNTVTNNTESGIAVMSGSNYNSIDQNTSTGNKRGIQVDSSSNNTFSNNVVNNNTVVGIVLANASQSNTVNNNNISQNGSEGGIKLVGGSTKYNLLSQNTVNEYPNTPINITSGANGNIATVSSAEAYYSPAKDLFVSGTASGPGLIDVYCSSVNPGYLSHYLGQATISDDQSFTYTTASEYFETNQCVDISLIRIDPANNTSRVYAVSSLVLDGAAPTVSADPEGGVYTTTQTVALTATDTYDTFPVIYYTLDGTDPTTASEVYSQALTISQDTILKYFAVDHVNNSSEILTQTYSISPEGDDEDKAAPVISQIQVSNLTQNSALITWTTDEASTSRVRYGTNQDDLNETVNSPSLVTSHSLQLSGLDEETKYYYRVFSTDASGNRASSAAKSFTTLAPAPVITSPEEGDIIYLNQRLNVLGTGTPEDVIKLYLNGNYQDQDIVDDDGNWQTKTNKPLVPNSHNLRAKDTTKDVNSEVINIIRATQEVTNRVRVNISNKDLKQLPAAEQLNTVYPGKPTFYGLCTNGDVVKVFINGVYNGDATLTPTNNPNIVKFEYVPFLNLTSGISEVQVKVYNNNNLVEEGPIRTINVYGHPAPTVLTYDNQNKLISGLAYPGSWISIYVDDVYQGTIQADSGSGQAAGFTWNVSNLTNGVHVLKARASHVQTGPYSRYSNTFEFTKYSNITSAPTTPTTPDNDTETTPDTGDSTQTNPDTTTETPDKAVDSDQDGVSDKDEEYLGTDPQDASDGDQAKEEYEEKIIEIKEKEYKDSIKEEDNPGSYDPISDPDVELTPAEKEKLLKDLNDKAKTQTVLSVATNGDKQSLTSGDTGIVYSTLDVKDAFWSVLTGQEPEQKNDNTITLHGRIPVVEGAAPGYAVVTLFSDPIVKIAQAQENGEWTLSVPVDYLPEGEHTAFLQTDVNGVTSDQVEIARFVIQEKQRFSNTTIFFLFNIGLAILALLLAIALQLRKNRRLIEEMKKQEANQQQQISQ